MDKQKPKANTFLTKTKRFSYKPKLTTYARKLRSNMTYPEIKLWKECLSKQKVRFLRQRPIGNYIADFYCASAKLVIEVDGEVHFDDVAREYDQRRTQALAKLGLRILRFSNKQVLDRFPDVCNIIEEHLMQS